MYKIAIVSAILLALTGIALLTGQPAQLGSGSGCSVRDQLPDPVCTPGSVNPNVTQANIHQTICVKGWTATVRPSVSYTNGLKQQQMNAYGLTGNLSSFEEDHLIPLEIGGNPTDLS